MYYLLRLHLPPALPIELHKLYKDAVDAHNTSIDTSLYFDAGFNLICPADVEVQGLSTAKIDMGVCGAMDFVSKDFDVKTNTEIKYTIPVGYFLYPRSSTGTKTPLRLANSVGIIDAGYRGNYIAAFDNIRPVDFKVDKEQRLVQICPPNMTYPLRVELVNGLDETERGVGGFGSTGK